jgi:hypothetical protein
MKKIVTSLIVSTLSISSLYGAYNDANTDYTNAQSEFSTKVEALRPLKTVNQIICFTQHLRPELMVNKGVYSALIDNKLCSTSKSSNKNAQNDYVIAEVKRDSDTSPQIMNIWIPKGNVKVRMEMTKEASDADPVGQFNITWQIFNGETSVGKGEIKTVSADGGKVGYTFFTKYGDTEDSSSIIKSPDSTEGIAFTSYSGSTLYNEPAATYALAWKDKSVLSKVNNKQVSLLTNFNGDANETCQDKSQVKKSVWSYGVYKQDDGSSLNIQTSFPFEANKDGKTIQGSLSYGGRIWIEGDKEEGKSFDVITEIKKINYTDDTKTDITISKNGDGTYTAKYTNGEVISFDKPVSFKYGDYKIQYYGDGSLWFVGYNDNNPITLENGTTLNDGKNDYVVKALQGVNTLTVVDNTDCDALELKDPAEPLPTSISNNAVFNEGNTPDRPANVSIIDGELQN